MWFVVVRSSNPEGNALQLARLPDGRSVAEHVADEIAAHNAADETGGLGRVGAVLGATQGREAGDLANRLPNAPLLVPGIGAQGATIADVRRDFAAHYPRVIPAVSRAISRAGPEPTALRERVLQLIAEIRAWS